MVQRGVHKVQVDGFAHLVNCKDGVVARELCHQTVYKGYDDADIELRTSTSREGVVSLPSVVPELLAMWL